MKASTWAASFEWPQLKYHSPASLRDTEGYIYGRGADTALDHKNLGGLEPYRP